MGLERRLGTLEPGKLGQVVAFSAPFQNEQAKARFVLIDGLKFEVKAPEPGAAEGRPGSGTGPGSRRGGGPRPDSSARPGSQRPSPPQTGDSPDAAKTNPETPTPDAKKESPRPPKGIAELAEAKPKTAPPAEPKPKSAQPPADVKPKTASPPPSEKPKAEPAGGHGPSPVAKPASPEEKAPPKPLIDVATEFDADRAPRIKTGGSVLIKDATILTVSRGTIARGSILVEHGKITAVGTGVMARPGMAVIEAAGLVAMPGIIDTHSHIAIQGGVNEMSLSIVPEVRVKDVVTGDDVSIYRALAGGTTTARLLHGSANTIGGQDAVVKLRYGKPGRELVIRDAPQGVKFALGENVTRSQGRFPNSRMGVESVIERAFEEGKAYSAEWKSYEQSRLKDKDKDKAGPPPRRDLRLEALAQIVEGSIRIHSHCYRSDEILMLLRTAERYGVRVQSLQHVLEGYKVAAEISDHGASASTFSDWWAYKVEAYDAIPFNAALLTKAGANVCIKSDSEELNRHLNLEAAKMVKYGGVSEAQALAMITLNPARARTRPSSGLDRGRQGRGYRDLQRPSL